MNISNWENMEPDLLQSFREEFQEFQCFTEEELEEAVRTARREIQGELEQYEVYQTQHNIITKPKRIVSVATGFHQTPRDFSDEDEDELGETSETASSVSEDNTVSLSVSEQIPPKTNTTEKSRLSYSLDQLDLIFADIFKSINVNRNYVAKDSLESERANKRVKDFSARFGRSLYQTKQNFISFKNLVLRSQLAGQARPSQARLEGRLAQLFISCRSLLTSYLHFIPLSGGQIFPPLLSDALEVLLDIANLTVSLGFSTNNLAAGIRQLESLMSERSQLPDVTKLEILNNLAETTFGPRDETKVRRSPRKAGSGQGQVSIKPRGNKIFQQRTNLARQRRMKDIEQRNQEKLFPPPSTTDISLEQTQSKVPHVTPAPANRRNLVDDRKTLRDQLMSGKHQQTPSDMKNILRRLHNLELIASSDPTTGAVSEGGQSQYKSDDLNFLINRLEIIESDFDLIATKYKDRLRPRPKFSTRCTLEDLKYFSLKEADVKCEESPGVAKDRIEAIVHKITDEILADDLLLN